MTSGENFTVNACLHAVDHRPNEVYSILFHLSLTRTLFKHDHTHDVQSTTDALN